MVDGWPTDRVEEASRLARESGINIFFVTIEAAAQNEKQNVIEPNFVDKVLGWALAVHLPWTLPFSSDFAQGLKHSHSYETFPFLLTTHGCFWSCLDC